MEGLMHTATKYEIAQLVAALLNLDEMRIVMHVNNGALDQAIESILPDLSKYYANAFQFIDTADGRRCIQPPDIAMAMVEADCGVFVSNILRVTLNPPYAHIILHGMGFERTAREQLSKKLLAALHAAIERLEDGAAPVQRRTM